MKLEELQELKTLLRQNINEYLNVFNFESDLSMSSLYDLNCRLFDSTHVGLRRIYI